MIAGLLAAWLALGVAIAAPTDHLSETDRIEAALAQVRLWIDLGELAKAETLTRRGVVMLPGDVRWHRARLDALQAAGMDPWIAAEYADKRLSSDVAAVFAVWEVDVGRRLGLPDGLTGPGVDVARARLALRRGQRGPAEAEAEQDDDRDHLALRAELVATPPEADAITALLFDWPEGAPLAPLAPVFEACGATKARRTCDARLAAIRADVTTTEDVLTLVDAAELGVAIGDAALLEGVHTRVRALDLPHDLQAQVDGFSGGPAAWIAWEVPRTPRRTPAELDAIGASLAAKGDTRVPWGRDDERRRIAVALAEQLQRDKQVVKADRVLVDVLGPCTPSIEADVLIAGGQAHEGRELAVDRLLACLGGTDLVPSEDPAGLEIDARIDDVADAWLRFGRTCEIGRWTEDAALAFALAARLSPDPDVVALARSRAKAVGFAVDPTGLPPIADLIARLDDALWLRPASMLQATRATRAKARTIAWLDPTPAHLLARVTPDRLCLSTIRSRCHLERALAARAFERAHQPVPADAVVVDAGAQAASGPLLDRLRQVRFQRTAELSHLLGTEVPRDLSDILAGRTGARVGYRAPRWTSGGVRSADLDHRVVVLVFWASWSRPSLPELLLVDGLAARWDSDGLPVRVFAVSVDTSETAYRRALPKLELSSAQLVRDPDLRDTFEIGAVPAITVVDTTGVLRELRAGYDDSDLSWLDGAVRSWAAMSATER